MKILAFAREVGGIAALAPVCRAMLGKGWDLLLLSKDHGLGAFKDRGLDSINFPTFDTPALEYIVRERLVSQPDIIFTSAVSLPTLDMTEKYLWRWGLHNGIVTVGVLDQWQNYALRFSGTSENERLAYLPNYILVMDETARNEMINEGIPEDKIIITGQPAFDGIAENVQSLSLRSREIRRKSAIPDDNIIVTFVAESLRKDFGDSLGYDEQSTLFFLCETLETLAAEQPDLKIYLLIKLHPENSVEEFEWIAGKRHAFNKRIIKKELTPHEVIAISDYIVGMSSVMLIEAMLADRPTISLQLNSRTESQLIATKAGAIPFIDTVAEGKEVLNKLVCSEEFRRVYLQRQRKWNINAKATENCINFLNQIGNRNKESI